MTHYQTANTCNVEFLKSSQGMGIRIIKLNYNEQAIPPQLVGRIDHNAWASFMREVQILANRHPYVIPPSSKQMGRWAACFGVGAIMGLFCINPDGGSYPQWYGEVRSMLDLWRPLFGQAGCALSLRTERCCYVQIDIVGPFPPAPVPLQQVKSSQHGGPTSQDVPYGKKDGYEPPSGPHWQQQQQWGVPHQGQQNYPQQQHY